MAKNCIFCQIIAEKAPANIVYKDEEVIIFTDIRPAAEFHYLIVPTRHIDDCTKLVKEDSSLIKTMVSHAHRILEENGSNIQSSRFGFHWPPFRSVAHLHLHAISPTSDMGVISRIIFSTSSFWFVSPEYVLERLSRL